MCRYIGVLDGQPGGYGIYFPELGGCTAMGNDLEDAYANAIDAMRLWAEDAMESKERLPVPRDMASLRADPIISEELATGAPFVVVPLLLDQGRPKRANISIDAGLLEAIDAAARESGLTRSAFLASAARDKIARGV